MTTMSDRYLAKKARTWSEYALMLAIIVGIGWLIYQQGHLADSIKQVFSDSSDLMTKAATTSSEPPASGAG